MERAHFTMRRAAGPSLLILVWWAALLRGEKFDRGSDSFDG